MVSSSPPIHIPVFAGQGTAGVNDSQTRQQALLDCASPSGSTLLAACHEAFHDELSAIPASDIAGVDVDSGDFLTKESLLALPNPRYINNPAISGPTLFIIQSLRYLAFVEKFALNTNSLTPFRDVLKPNSENGLGVLGFSSGILPACVAGTSLTVISYISKSVEAYRLAIWIGIRTQLFRRRTLDAASINLDTTLPWSIVFRGMTKTMAEESITNFINVKTSDLVLVLTHIGFSNPGH